MNGFTYARAATLAEAIGGTFIAGGTDLLQLWGGFKFRSEHPHLAYCFPAPVRPARL